MKLASKKNALLLVALSAGLVSLGGCKSTATIPLNFVAVTSSDWNASVNIGDYAYKFKGIVVNGNSFSLKGITQGKAQNQGGSKRLYTLGLNLLDPTDSEEQTGEASEGGEQSGEEQTGEASKGGDQSAEEQTGEASKGAAEETVQSSEEGAKGGEEQSSEQPGGQQGGQPAESQEVSSAESEDFSEHDFEIKGTCNLEKGYGYILNLEDDSKTTIHVDYNKTEGRHEFYYTVKVGDASSFVKFQAKDPAFAKTLASDYKVWDERDSKYIFYAKSTGNNNSVATAYLYLHSDGSVVDNSPNGAQRSITYGKTWSEANDVITIKDGNNEYQSVKSVNPEHPGYMIAVGSKTYLHSANPNVRWKKMTPADFYGTPKYTFKGSYTTTGPDGTTNNVELQLTEDGKSRVYSGFDIVSEGTWVEDSGVITVTVGSDTFVSYVNDDQQLCINYTLTIQGNKGSSTVNVAFVEVK